MRYLYTEVMSFMATRKSVMLNTKPFGRLFSIHLKGERVFPMRIQRYVDLLGIV